MTLSLNMAVLIQLGLIALCWPLEQRFPRLLRGADSTRRLASIIALGCCSFGVAVLFQAQLFQPLIGVYSPLSVISISQLSIPEWLGFGLSLLLLDFVQYGLHWLSHKITPLWALHSIHHSDKHVTAATSLLHHPLETLVVYILTLFVLVVLGISVQVILAYAVLSMLHNAFSHANIRIPESVDRVLRFVIVTPDMHRTHHSVVLAEGNSNFSQIFPWWDWLFGTYTAVPSKHAADLKMGLAEPSVFTHFNLIDLLLQPFRTATPPNKHNSNHRRKHVQ